MKEPTVTVTEYKPPRFTEQDVKVLAYNVISTRNLPYHHFIKQLQLYTNDIYKIAFEEGTKSNSTENE